MLLDMHESIPQSWMESLLPDGEVLSCDPSLGLASSWRHKPCAQMCWAQSIHPCVPQTGVGEQFFGTERVFLPQSHFELLPLAVVDLHCAVSSGHFSAGLVLRQRQCWWWVCTLFITEKDLFFVCSQRNLEEESLLPLLHCRSQRNTVKLWMVIENIHFSLWVVSRAD